MFSSSNCPRQSSWGTILGSHRWHNGLGWLVLGVLFPLHPSVVAGISPAFTFSASLLWVLWRLCSGPFLPFLLPSSPPFLSSLGPSKGLPHHRCSIGVYRERMFPEQKTNDIFYRKFTVRQKPCAVNDQKERALGTICCLFRHGVSAQFWSPDSQIVVAPGPYVYLVPYSVASSFTVALARAFCKKDQQ